MSNQRSSPLVSKRKKQNVVGLYLGDYTYLSGLWQHWLPVLRALKLPWIPLWDGSFESEDALRNISTLIVPGGFCFDSKTAFGGPAGRERIRQAVAGGLNFVGTCYGANVAVSRGADRRIPRLKLVQGRILPPLQHQCRGTVLVDYDCGVFNYHTRSQKTAHVNGRVFGPGEYTTIGRFSANQPGPFQSTPPKPLDGHPAAVHAKCGKGHLFLFSPHPEMPVSYQYPGILDRVASGKASVEEGIRKCWHPPVMSRSNMRLLQGLFGFLEAGNASRRNLRLQDRRVERIALLAGAIELQKLHISEIEENLVAHLTPAKSPALQMTAAVLKRRIRQACRCLRSMHPDRIPIDDSNELERKSLPAILYQFAHTGDHPGYFKHMRSDYQVAQAKRLKTLKGKKHLALEKSLAMSIIDKLDPLIQLGQ